MFYHANACNAMRGIAIEILSACLSVCLSSVTERHNHLSINIIDRAMFVVLLRITFVVLSLWIHPEQVC